MDLPLIQGFAFMAWAIEHQPMASAERRDPGYIAQEVERLQQKAETRK